jgi:DNA-binding transcriptional LysR family regulator
MMLEQLDTLRALKKHKTTAQAAIALRITQSTVSKRLAALEQHCQKQLVEQRGRTLFLTEAGEKLLQEATPILLQLQELLQPASVPIKTVILGSTESLLAGGLPSILAQSEVSLELHVHRGPYLIERVRSGQLDAAICAAPGVLLDLVVEPVGVERMVYLGKHGECWGIEETSLTGRWQRQLGLKLDRQLESFVVLTQLARAGFCRALVPERLALSLGVPAISLESTPYARPIALIARKSVWQHPEVQKLSHTVQGFWL